MKLNVRVLNLLIICLDIKDLLPNILKQLGPRQFSFMQEYAETLKNNKKEEAPELVEDFEQASEK